VIDLVAKFQRLDRNSVGLRNEAQRSQRRTTLTGASKTWVAKLELRDQITGALGAGASWERL